MNDVVFVSLISAGGAIAVALTTQFLAARVASKSADRAERREAQQWQRTEDLRRVELDHQSRQAELAWTRQEAQRLQELHDARLGELWVHVLNAQNRMLDALKERAKRPPPAGLGSVQEPPSEHSSPSAAAHAYAVALVGLPEVRPAAKAFYLATAKAHYSVHYDADFDNEIVKTWRASLDALEATIVESAAVKRVNGE